jgi:hypothetical protein
MAAEASALPQSPFMHNSFSQLDLALGGCCRLNQSPLAMCFESGDHEYWVASSSAPNEANNLR